ncbi:MAG TPA: DUF1489 domain-containing protein [Caulobacteraceae bacterium]|nr:DUF1489 domain-containing protein [Caulobacteraceae bacterium]
MPLNLIKLAVGIRDIDHLREVQARRAADGIVPVYTRQVPKRADEIVGTGSLYWVIRGSTCVRQRVVAIDTGVDEDGKAYCIIGVEAEPVPTIPAAQRPFQGWRYLEPAAAPADLSGAAGPGEELPPHLAAELRALGLL